MSNTFLGFDFGTKNIGVASGQLITRTAQPLPALKASDGIPDWEQIASILKEWAPDAAIVGCPLNMDGSEQPMTQRARKFANRLHGRFGLKVHFFDERLTSKAAKEEVFAQGGYRKLKNVDIDSIAAVLILESWMEQQTTE